MKKYKWVFVSGVYLILILLDGLLTYINTPDLKMEANPLVKDLGLGWGALFLANAVGYVIFVLLARCACRYRYENVKASSLFDYYMKLFYGEGYCPFWFWFKRAKNRRAFWAYVGFVYIYAMIAARIVLVLDWSFTTWNANVPWWDEIWRGIPFRRLDLWTALAVCIGCIIWWPIRAYRSCEKATGQK